MKEKKTSTERLLRMIRMKSGTVSQQDASDGIAQTPLPVAGYSRKQHGKLGALFSKSLNGSFRKRATIGVDVGAEGLRVVKIADSESNPRLENFAYYPYEPETPKGAPGFSRFLRTCLQNYCGDARSVNLWTIISSARVDLWHVQIPVVPRKQIAETVYWAVKKEKKFDDSKMILDFEIQETTVEKGTSKYVVMVWLAPKVEVEEADSLFQRAGYKVSGISIAPIAIQNLFRSKWFPDAPEVCANLFLGRDWARIDIFSSGNLVLTRGIKTGTSSLVECLVDSYNRQLLEQKKDEPPAPVLEMEPTLEMQAPVVTPEVTVEQPVEGDSASIIMPTLEIEGEDELEPSAVPSQQAQDPVITLEVPSTPVPETEEDILEEVAEDMLQAEEDGFSSSNGSATLLDMDSGKRLLVARMLDEHLPADFPGAELSEEEVFEMASPAVERLVRQIERTFEFFGTTYKLQPVGKIFFSGYISKNERLKTYISSQLGIEIDMLDPMPKGNPHVGTVAVPRSLTERIAYTPALALALSSRRLSPNLLETFVEKEKLRVAGIVQNAVVCVFLLILLGLAGTHFWLEHQLTGYKQQRDALANSLAQYKPEVTEPLLLKMAKDAGMKQRGLKAMSQKALGVAVLGELSEVTPAEVRLLRCTMQFDSSDTEAKKNGKSGSVYLVEGIVGGDPRTFDAALASYLVKLEMSPLFGPPSVQERRVATTTSGDEVMRFTIRLGAG